MPVPLSLSSCWCFYCVCWGEKLTLVSQLWYVCVLISITQHIISHLSEKHEDRLLLRMYYFYYIPLLQKHRPTAAMPFPTSPATGKARSCLALSSFHIYHTRRSFPKAKAIPLSLLSPTFTTSIFHFFTTQFAQGVTQSSTHWLFTVNILPQINFSFVYLSLPLCLLLCYNCRDLYYNSTLFTIINTIKITVKTHFSVIFFNTHKRHSLSNVSPLQTHTTTTDDTTGTSLLTRYILWASLSPLFTYCSKWNIFLYSFQMYHARDQNRHFYNISYNFISFLS